MSYRVSFTVGDYPVCEVVAADSIAQAIWKIRTTWLRPRIWSVVRHGR